MKRICAAILLAVLLFAPCACAEKPADPKTPPESPSIEPPSAAPKNAPTPTADGEQPGIVGTTYLDLSDRVFAVCPDWSGTAYCGSGVYQLQLLSADPIPTESVSVEADLPDGATINASVFETVFDGVRFGKNRKGAEDDTESDLDFSFDQYLCTIGFDWATLGALYREERRCLRNGDPEGQMRIGDEMMAMTETHRAQYYALTAEALPHFYAYSVVIEICVGTDASFDRIVLKAGDLTATVPVGTVTLRCEEPNWASDNPAIRGGLIATAYRSDSYYEDGYYLCFVPCSLAATTDLTLMRLRFIEEGTTLRRAQLVLTDPDGMLTDLAWDGLTPIDLAAGTTIELQLGFYTDRLLRNGATVWATAVADCRVDGQKESVEVFSLELDWNRSPIEQWLEHTQGIDFEPYYREYYRSLTDYERGEVIP